MRAPGPLGRPIDALVRRDFGAFEDALGELAERGFVLRAAAEHHHGRGARAQLRVRYGECDPQGVVFNAHYLAYFDTSITELWRAAFGSYQAMLDRGVDIVLAEASCGSASRRGSTTS